MVPYDPVWIDEFGRLRRRIADALGDLRAEIEHVGSPAVPGLASKRVVDFDVVVASPTDVPVAIERLAALGYVHEGDLGVPGREAFRFPAGEPRHHLYLVVSGGEPHRDHVDFRDYLIARPEQARAYAALKSALAAEHPHDREAYSAGKHAFIERALAQARRTANAEARP